MQPPPRKGNYTKFLKNLHSEQIAKLLLKNQHECELLEDIRTFTIKRSAIEKSYSEALLKISSAYLNKKIPNIPDIKLDGGEEKWNMWNVWRTVLEENEKLARARLAAVEVFQQQIADDAKILRTHKVQSARRCVEQLSVIQKELQACVQDVDKTKKLYFDEEHTAHDVRDKARDIEEKLKKKKGSFFQSITSLQKNSAKFTSKREQLEEKSSGARNDYLLCLAAANAHQNRYFVVDLQLTLSTMESNVFDKVAEYLTLMGRTELLTCSAMQNSFSTIRDQAKQLTREYNLQCCYLYYPVLKQHIQYDFEPCDNDPVEHVSADHESAAATLSKEARRWATRIAREENAVREAVRKLQMYNALRESGQKVDPNDPNGPDLDTRIEEMKTNVRRAETAKLKAEARIECLRKGGVNVDEWLQEAETLTVQDIQRSTSSLSMRTDASGTGDHPSSDSFYDSDYADADTTTLPMETRQEIEEMRTGETESYEGQEVDAVLEQERQRIEQLTAGWDDPTQVDWGAIGDQTDGSATDTMAAAATGPTLKCTALYSYTAQNPDELSIVENEQLEVVGEGDGDGWLRARNYKGEEGYVPQNYLDVERDQPETTAGSSGGPCLVNQISFSSVDYTVDNETDETAKNVAETVREYDEDEDEEALQNTEDTNQSPEQVSVISVPNKPKGKPSEEDEFERDVYEDAADEEYRGSGARYCCALYDYDGDDGELTFDEGQVIRILSRRAHDGIDDGWWRGELDGRVGNFPSLVVEECDAYGAPLTDHPDDYEEPCSAPPVFAPPDAPDYFFDETQFDADEAYGDEAPAPQYEPPPPPPPPPGEDDDDDAEIEAKRFDVDGDTFVDVDGKVDDGVKDIQGAAATPLSGFSMTMSADHRHQYDAQFEGDDAGMDVPSVVVDEEGFEDGDGQQDQQQADYGLGVAQIVITAATPMIEEADHSFPAVAEEEEEQEQEPKATEPENCTTEPGKEEEAKEVKEVEESTKPREQEAVGDHGFVDDGDFIENCMETPPQEDQKEKMGEGDVDNQDQKQIHQQEQEPIDLADDRQPLQQQDSQCGVSSSTCSEGGDTTGPSTAENSIVVEPKLVVGGRASIPDELEPHQLARLQDLKESNA